MASQRGLEAGPVFPEHGGRGSRVARHQSGKPHHCVAEAGFYPHPRHCHQFQTLVADQLQLVGNHLGDGSADPIDSGIGPFGFRSPPATVATINHQATLGPGYLSLLVGFDDVAGLEVLEV